MSNQRDPILELTDRMDAYLTHRQFEYDQESEMAQILSCARAKLRDISSRVQEFESKAVDKMVVRELENLSEQIGQWSLHAWSRSAFNQGYAWRNSLEYIISRLKEDAVVAVSQWQPIETAPKDGTVIDVWLGDAEEADVEFYCTYGTRRSPGWAYVGGKFRPTAGLACTGVFSVFVQPTHWMPVPDGPKE